MSVGQGTLRSWWQRASIDQVLPASLLAALATTLMLEATRVFLAYMIFVVDQAERTQIGVYAAIVYGSPLLVIGLARLLGPRWTLAGTVGLLAGSRLIVQVWQQPSARMYLGAVAVAAWGWLIAALFARWREATAFGIGLGLALDLAIRLAFSTVDLPFMPNATRHLLTVLLIALLAASAAPLLGYPARAGFRERSWGACASLIGLGPGLAIYHLVTGNLGLAQVRFDQDLGVAGLRLLLALVVGVAAGTGLLLGVRRLDERRSQSQWALLIVMVVLTALGLWLLWSDADIAQAAGMFGGFGAATLFVHALRGPTTPEQRTGLTATAVWLTVGLLLQAAVVFVYFAETGQPRFLIIPVAGLIVAALLAGAPQPVPSVLHIRRFATLSAAALALALAVSVSQLVQDDEPAIAAPLSRDITVMTYNIQAGFSRDNVWSLEAIAQTIEAEQPDIVILQEVSRGWPVLTGVDEVAWLSERLAMPYIFGAASRDGLWGNAILTRAPISESLVRRFDSTVNLHRGALEAQVETEIGTLWVYATHLDNPDDAGSVRLEQVKQVVALWDGKSPAVIGGDFNATPDSDVFGQLIDAGLMDAGASLGADASTSERGSRIDHIFVTPEIAVREVRIPDVWTSDHKPFVAEILLPPDGTGS